MHHVCIRRFDVIGTVEKKLATKQGLNEVPFNAVFVVQVQARPCLVWAEKKFANFFSLLTTNLKY